MTPEAVGRCDPPWRASHEWRRGGTLVAPGFGLAGRPCRRLPRPAGAGPVERLCPGLFRHRRLRGQRARVAPGPGPVPVLRTVLVADQFRLADLLGADPGPVAARPLDPAPHAALSPAAVRTAPPGRTLHHPRAGDRGFLVRRPADAGHPRVPDRTRPVAARLPLVAAGAGRAGRAGGPGPVRDARAHVLPGAGHGSGVGDGDPAAGSRRPGVGDGGADPARGGGGAGGAPAHADPAPGAGGPGRDDTGRAGVGVRPAGTGRAGPALAG